MSQPLIIGLGHEFRGDDGIGSTVLKALAKGGLDEAELVELASDPLALLEIWENRETVIVDAIQSGLEPGAIIELDALNDRLPTTRPASSHAIDLASVIALGRVVDRLPKSLWLIGIEAETFAQGASLSARVRQSVESAVLRVLSRLEKINA